MSMKEVICPSCGAINQADAQICWRCLADLHAVPAEPAASDGAAPAA